MPVHVAGAQAERVVHVHVQKAGKFAAVDPLNKNKKATVTVKAAPAAVVTRPPRPYRLATAHDDGRHGHALDRPAGQKVEIFAQACGDNNAKSISTVTTTTGGAFTYQAPAGRNTSYHARYRSDRRHRDEHAGERHRPSGDDARAARYAASSA